MQLAVLEPRVRGPVRAAGQPGQDVGDIPDQLDLREIELIYLRGHAVDDHDLLVPAGIPVLGRVLDQVVAHRDHQVGLLKPGHLVVPGL